MSDSAGLVYSGLSDHTTIIYFQIIILIPKRMPYPLARLPNTLFPAPGNKEFIIVSMDLPILYIIYKWNDAVYGFSVWLFH